METDLQHLLQLQAQDSAIDDLKEQVEDLTARIQAKNTTIENMRVALKTAKDAFSSHSVKKKQLEMEAESKEQLVKKHQGELNVLKSNDAYKSMLGEISGAKAALHKIEDDILTLMEEVEKDEKDYRAKEQVMKSDEGKIKAEIQAIESDKNKLLAEVKSREDVRQQFAAEGTNQATNYSGDNTAYIHFCSPCKYVGSFLIRPATTRSWLVGISSVLRLAAAGLKLCTCR